DEALGHFRQAAGGNPNYVFVSGNFPQSVWTFIGRTHYYRSEFIEARQCFERALQGNKKEHIARLYLGLTLAHQNDHSAALRECKSGLDGLRAWIDQANSQNPHASLWDPQGEIRQALAAIVNKLTVKEIDWRDLIHDADRVAARFDDEIDHVRRDENRRLGNET